MSLQIKHRENNSTLPSFNYFKLSRVWLLVVCGVSFLGLTSWAWAEPTSTTLPGKKMATKTAKPILAGTWYGPKKAFQGQKYPLAVILASKDFPVGRDDYWIHTLRLLNYSTLVLKCSKDKWKNVGVSQIKGQIARCPKSIPADPSQILLICDQASAPLAMRFMDGYPKEMIGIVLISVSPIEITSRGLSLWSPRPESWTVPIWAIVGTGPKDAGKVLKMWRKLQSYAPAEASMTVDTRIGRGVGHLLPDESIVAWLQSAAAGEKPKPGIDQQAQEERKRFSILADAMAGIMEQTKSIARAGRTFTKTEGPFVISFVAPAGWERDLAGERKYNPRGLAADKDGLPLDGKKNPYSEIYITPKRQGSFFARVYTVEWKKTSTELLADYHRKLVRKGYLQASIKRWQQGAWAYEISSIMIPWQGKWARWLTFAAARGGSPEKPAGTIVLVMDSSGNIDGTAMAGALKRICKSVITSKK